MAGPRDADARLFDSIRSQDVDGCRRALAAGASPDAETEAEPFLATVVPALVLAARTGSVPLVDALLDAGASVDRRCTERKTYAFNDDATEFEGVTALGAAAGQGHLLVARRLLEGGASVDVGSPPALIAALRAGRLDVARALIDAGANPNSTDGDSHSALRYAAEAGNEPLLRLVQDAGGRFAGELDRAEAVRQARREGQERIAALLENGRARDWIQSMYTRWRIRARPAAPEELLGEIMLLLYRARGSQGPIRSEHTSSSPWGGEPSRRSVEQTLDYGPWQLTRTVVEEFDPPGASPETLKLKRTRLLVVGGVCVELRWEGDAAAGEDGVFELSVLGDGAELDRVDGLLEGSSIGVAREHLGDRAP